MCFLVDRSWIEVYGILITYQRTRGSVTYSKITRGVEAASHENQLKVLKFHTHILAREEGQDDY
jgi:hypothetical protein